jgi:hypothetical protein
MLLALGLPFAAKSQDAPPTSDLRQLVEAMQKVAKPSVGQPLPPMSRSAVGNVPMPLRLNGSYVTLDSLNRYTLRQTESVRLNLNEPMNTALYGIIGSWGVIEITLKKISK